MKERIDLTPKVKGIIKHTKDGKSEGFTISLESDSATESRAMNEINKAPIDKIYDKKEIDKMVDEMLNSQINALFGKSRQYKLPLDISDKMRKEVDKRVQDTIRSEFNRVMKIKVPEYNKNIRILMMSYWSAVASYAINLMQNGGGKYRNPIDDTTKENAKKGAWMMDGRVSSQGWDRQIYTAGGNVALRMVNKYEYVFLLEDGDIAEPEQTRIESVRTPDGRIVSEQQEEPFITNALEKAMKDIAQRPEYEDMNLYAEFRGKNEWGFVVHKNSDILTIK